MTRPERIGERIAEEAQLLAEEKWIIQALTNIKKQRNCLQIERLQLESLEARLRLRPTFTNSDLANNGPTLNGNVQGTSTTMKPLATITGSTRNGIEFEVPLVEDEDPVKLLDLDACNDEELDLAVSKSVFNTRLVFRDDLPNVCQLVTTVDVTQTKTSGKGNEFKKNVLEEDEEEDDDDMLIDMNMFMNSKSSYGK